MKKRCHQVANNENRQICGAVIGLVVMKFLAAHGTGFAYLEIPAQQLAFTAIGAFASPPFPYGGPGCSFHLFNLFHYIHFAAPTQSVSRKRDEIKSHNRCLRRDVARKIMLGRRKPQCAPYDSLKRTNRVGFGVSHLTKHDKTGVSYDISYFHNVSCCNFHPWLPFLARL